MMLKNNKVNEIKEAVNHRDIVGYRFDNTKYWENYYHNKVTNRDVSREARYVDFLAKKINIKSKILDVGTGYGFLPMEFKKRGFDVVGLDKFKGMIRLAEKYFKENNQIIKIYESDLTEMPFKDNSFEMITAISVLEHFSLEEINKKVIPEISRLVKKEGMVFIHVPVKSMTSLIKKWVMTYVNKSLPSWACDDESDVTHKIWLTTEQYIKLMRQSGFKVKYITFNFIRSNEDNSLIRGLNKFFSSMCCHFYKIENKIPWYLKIWSLLATSIAFVSVKM